MQKSEISQGKILKETWPLIKLLMNIKSKESSCFRPGDFIAFKVLSNCKVHIGLSKILVLYPYSTLL